MKKRLIIVIGLFLAICIIFHIGNNQKSYEVYEENEQWYLKVLKYVPDPYTSPLVMTAYGFHSYIFSRDYNSVTEMAAVIKDGELTDEELFFIQYPHSSGTPIPIINLDKLYVPVLPDGLTLAEKVTGYTESYVLYFDENVSGIKGSIAIDYTESKSNKQNEQEDNSAPRIALDNSNAKKTAKDVLGEFKSKYDNELIYWLDTGSNVFFVKEFHKTDQDTNKIWLSFWEEDVCFDVTLSGFDAFPTMEWLAAFGVIPVE